MQETTTRQPPETRAWGSAALGVGIGADASLTFLGRDLGAIIALTEIAVPAIIALAVLVAVLRGSENTCERAFRLLRWLANRPEPPRMVAAHRHTEVALSPA